MYEQKIDINLSKKVPILLRITNCEKVPRRCYCRFDESGCVKLTVYTISADGNYIIAEGNSDHTVFMLLKVVEKQDDMYITEYIDNGTNPMDEMYSRLSSVYWYDEFCKLKFFNSEMVPDSHDCCRRIYFK